MGRDYKLYNYCVTCIDDTKEARQVGRAFMRYPKVFIRCVLCKKFLRTKPRRVKNRLSRYEGKYID